VCDNLLTHGAKGLVGRRLEKPGFGIFCKKLSVESWAEGKKARGAMRHAPRFVIRLFEDFHGFHFFTEIANVDAAADNNFKRLLKFRE
jgi:hypothetical protein